jgi:hypothetical protein
MSIESANGSVLKQVFDMHIEETFTDEQVRRVLEPVLRLIREGAFDRPQPFFAGGRRMRLRPVVMLFKNLQ